MWKKSILLLVVFSGIVLGTALYKYIYHEHKSVATAASDYSVSSKELVEAFITDPEKASKKYLEAIVTVSGSITETDSEGMLLSSGVFCYFLDSIPKYDTAKIKIKGRCIGYDELLEVVKIDQCSIVN